FPLACGALLPLRLSDDQQDDQDSEALARLSAVALARFSNQYAQSQNALDLTLDGRASSIKSPSKSLGAPPILACLLREEVIAGNPAGKDGRRSKGSYMNVMKSEAVILEYTIRQCVALEEFEACLQMQRDVWQFSDLDVTPLRSFVIARRGGGFTLGAF